MEYTLKCKDCGSSKVFSARTLRGLYDKARDEGWAISADYTRKWCPNCADSHRHVGKGGAKPKSKATSFVQIKLNII